MKRRVSLPLALVLGLSPAAISCGDADARDDSPRADVSGVRLGETHPEVTDASAEPSTDGSWTFSVTIRSPYDSPERYADAWRVSDADGTELGIRILTHHHADEQPFTRSLGGVVIPSEVKTVFVEGRDLQNGWSGQRYELVLGASD